MAISRNPGVFGFHAPIVCDSDIKGAPARSPGSMGINDAADPSCTATPGDTGGPIGTGGDLAWLQAHGLNLGNWSSRLSVTKGKLSAFDEFKANVLAEEIAMRTRLGRERFEAVPESELVVVEGDKKMRTQAASRLKELLAAARADLKAEQVAFGKLTKSAQDAARAAAAAQGSVVVTDVKRIWVQSAYRDFKYDENLWHDYFKNNYYPSTQAQRAKLPGGEHGKAAVKYLARYISPKKAPPGFSNHSNGKAVDFGTQEGHTVLVGKIAQNPRWQKSWLHKWLVSHHEEYDFKPLSSEAWHWDYDK
jgi:hypothetical protein